VKAAWHTLRLPSGVSSILVSAPKSHVTPIEDLPKSSFQNERGAWDGWIGLQSITRAHERVARD
jgi:hypothetical protein